MSPSRRPSLGLGIAVVVVGLSSLACTVDPRTCDELRDQVTIEELVAPGLSPELALAVFEAAPQPTLAWLDPAVLDDGWGRTDLTLDHAGTCTTPLKLDVEPRADTSTWIPPELEFTDACGMPGLSIPVHVRLASEDGVLTIEADSELVGTDADHLSLTLTLDAAPSSLALQLGPPERAGTIELLVHAELVDGQLSGDVRVYSHDCSPAAECTYWAEFTLATFG